MIRFLMMLVVLAGLLVGGAGLFVIKKLASIDGPLDHDTVVYIAPGTPVAAMARQLSDAGAIDAAWIFRAESILKRAGGPLKAGEYEIKDGMSTDEIIALLQSGKTYVRSLTIPEGLMSVEIVDLVNHAEAMEGVVSDIPAEGSLLPETYHYTRGDSRAAMIARMQKSMQDKLAQLWDKRSPAAPVNTPQEAVTLASIVEKETGVAAERARVAGVFANRLRQNMPLQSDPTVIYAITQGQSRLDRPLSRADLQSGSPYNTYTHPGLPPGPIANPGAQSLQAVLSPEANDYLYFVADGTGGHAFARSLAEHNSNVGKWRAHVKMMRDAQPAAPAPAANDDGAKETPAADGAATGE